MSKSNFSAKKSNRFVFFSFLVLAIGFVFAAQLVSVKSNAENADNFSNPTEETQVSNIFLKQPQIVESHTLVGTYYSLRNNLTATLLLNNKGALPLQVTPTFFSLNGTRLQLAPITVGEASYREIDIREMLNGAGEEFREGSLQITYQGKRLQLGSQIKLIDETNSLMWDEQIFEPSEKFVSSRLESVWWLPTNNCETKFVISNTTDAPVSTTITVDGTSPNQPTPKIIELNPHETLRLDVMRDLVGNAGRTLHETGGISISHSGAAGAVLARMLISKANKGFSSTMNFIDPQLTASSKWHGAGLRIGKINNQKLQPILAARNIGNQRTTVSGKIFFTNSNEEVVSINIPPTNVAANSTKTINLKGAINAANMPSSVKYAGIEIDYTTERGSVIMSAVSVSADDNHVFQVPLFDPDKSGTSAGGYPWKADGDYTTVVYIKNETDEPKQYIARLLYQGGYYMLGLKDIGAHETAAIDFRTLRDTQTAGERGQQIPLNIEKGQIAWSVFGDDNYTLSGRSEQVNIIKGVAVTYDCRNCCPDSTIVDTVTPGTTEASVGELFEFFREGRTENCYGAVTPIAFNNGNWTSSDTGTAIIGTNGIAQAMSPGEASLSSSWLNDEWFDLGGSRGCQLIRYPAEDSGEMMVRPRVIDVIADGATQVTKVIGDPKISHFVTPKGEANGQVTLTADLSSETPAILADISWEGATESASNPRVATLPKSTASKNIVRIKYKGSTIKELRVWVVWATITSTAMPITYEQANLTTSDGNMYQGAYIQGGYSFIHTIQPAEIVANDNQPKPDFKGSKMNMNGPPGGNHPIYNTSLTGGADKKWDNSRQIRWKIINPFNISSNYLLLPLYPTTELAYPTEDIVGNDDRSTGDNLVPPEETNDPYTNNGTLTGRDKPDVGLANIAGNNNETYEERLQFREFTRLEIEGTWYRISDFYLWRIHFKLKKTNGVWLNDSSSIALDNNGF